jgi:hypothetical protein
MTTKPFDQFNKRLFQELLSAYGQVTPNLAVLGEERAIDVFFAPYPNIQPDSAELGVLAVMAQQPALLEPFRSGLADEDVETCVMKLLMVKAELRRANPNISVSAPPYLWVLAAEVSDRILADFGGVIDPQLGEGFYRLNTGFKTTIVAIEELPTVPETLWLRLMGKGRTQDDAIADLLMLPESDIKRGSALNLLVSWRINMEITNQVEQEERRILMALSQVYLEWEKQTKRLGIEQGVEQGMQQGREQGMQQGLEEERRATIENLLHLRFSSVDSSGDVMIDQELQAIIPNLMNLPNVEYTRLLFQKSREELIQYFRP